MDKGFNSKCDPENKQDLSSHQIKQCIKIEKSDYNRLSRGRYFTIAHLYLAPASLSRQNTNVDVHENEQGQNRRSDTTKE